MYSKASLPSRRNGIRGRPNFSRYASSLRAAAMSAASAFSSIVSISYKKFGKRNCREWRTWSSIHIELRPPSKPHMQPHIWTDAEAPFVERDASSPRDLLQVFAIVEASTSRESNRHHSRFELNKLPQDGSNIQFLQLHPHVAELRTSYELHKNILRLCSVVRRRRVIVNLGNRQPRGSEETHCGHFTGDSIELGDRDDVWNAGYHLEAVMHSDQESPVEAAFCKPHKRADISRCATNRLRRKLAKFVNVELTSALCKAKIIVDTECARLWIRHIDDTNTMLKTYSQRPDE